MHAEWRWRRSSEQKCFILTCHRHAWLFLVLIILTQSGKTNKTENICNFSRFRVTVEENIETLFPYSSSSLYFSHHQRLVSNIRRLIIPDRVCFSGFFHSLYIISNIVIFKSVSNFPLPLLWNSEFMGRGQNPLENLQPQKCIFILFRAKNICWVNSERLNCW